MLTAERAAQALKAAGYDGLDTGELVEAVHASGVKRWEDARIAKSSVASSCTHDPAFVRLQKGRFALRALRPDLEVMPCALVWQILLHLLFWVSLCDHSCPMAVPAAGPGGDTLPCAVSKRPSTALASRRQRRGWLLPHAPALQFKICHLEHCGLMRRCVHAVCQTDAPVMLPCNKLSCALDCKGKGSAINA